MVDPQAVLAVPRRVPGAVAPPALVVVAGAAMEAVVALGHTPRVGG